MTNSPFLVGEFPIDSGRWRSLPGTSRVVSDSSVLWSRGGWRPAELRTVSYADGHLVTVGDCLASEVRLRADFRRALDRGRLEDLTRWPGAYLTIVVRADELTAFADLAGQFPLYYRHDPGRTVVGTRAAETVAAAGLSSRLDIYSMLAQVFCPAVPTLTEDRSAFDGLSRLGGGQALRVSANGACTTWTYESLVPDSDVDLPQAADALRTALVTAVRARVGTGRRLTADFSGGLDSTSLAFLATRELSGSLPAFTYHHPDAPADDLAHAERYAGLDERISLDVVAGTAASLPFQGMVSSQGADLPDAAAVTQARMRLRLARIAESGSEIHLGGEGADALLVAPPAYLAGLARFGTRRTLLAHCQELAGQRQVAAMSIFSRASRLSRTPLHRALERLAGSLEKPSEQRVRWLDAIAWWPEPGAEATWLTSRTRTDFAEFVREAARRVRKSGNVAVGDYVALGELRVAASVQRQLSDTARRFSVTPHAPFLDNDVVRSCLSLPSHGRADPLAFKPLLGRALTGLVPDAVLGRTTKGNYSPEDYHGIRRAAPELRKRVSTLKMADAGLIDTDAVKVSLEQAVAGIQAPFPALTRLFGADLWLEGLPCG